MFPPVRGDPLFGSHHTNSPGKTASGLWGFLPPATGHPHSRTIRLGYAIHFVRRLPKFHGVLSTSVRGKNAVVLRVENPVLLAKDAIETVPSAEMKKGFYSPYFIVPKKGGGLRDQDWFVAIDLKDAYFYVSILPRHRPFLRFAFEGRAYQYKVLPFGLSLSSRVFTK
ncbi:hypothetical protein M9458_048636, partial [Cirrhinus mrigala]